MRRPPCAGQAHAPPVVISICLVLCAVLCCTSLAKCAVPGFSLCLQLDPSVSFLLLGLFCPVVFPVSISCSPSRLVVVRPLFGAVSRPFQLLLPGPHSPALGLSGPMFIQQSP